jgi:hypothetical protein
MTVGLDGGIAPCQVRRRVKKMSEAIVMTLAQEAVNIILPEFRREGR